VEENSRLSKRRKKRKKTKQVTWMKKKREGWEARKEGRRVKFNVSGPSNVPVEEENSMANQPSVLWYS